MKPLIICLFLASLSLISGCTLHEKANSTAPAISLLVDSASFPKGWTGTPCDTSLCEKDGGQSSAERFYSLAGAPGHAYEEAYRCSSNRGAAGLFSTYKNGEFNQSEVRKPFVAFEPPSEIEFESEIADESYLACGVDVIPQCKYLARYQNYFVFFYFDHDTAEAPGGLTYSEIENVLVALEATVAAALEP